MTLPEIYLLIPQLLAQLKRIEAQNCAIVKILATDRWRERGKAAQELRRLREQVAALKSERALRVALTEELRNAYGDPTLQPPSKKKYTKSHDSQTR